jgi:hypothetical protein
VLAGLLAAPSSAAPAAKGASGRYLVLARSAADLGGLRAKAVADGAKVVRTIPQLNAIAAVDWGPAVAPAPSRGRSSPVSSAELPGQRSGVDVGALAGGHELADVVAGAGGEDRVAGVGPDRMGDPVRPHG